MTVAIFYWLDKFLRLAHTQEKGITHECESRRWILLVVKSEAAFSNPQGSLSSSFVKNHKGGIFISISLTPVPVSPLVPISRGEEGHYLLVPLKLLIPIPEIIQFTAGQLVSGKEALVDL